ncbi:MAG: D-sedoheptulose 7-phosphate isomerase [Nitrospirota bacterium]|nr:D-sedoheptulose 7-phosphate isomerase [Nitrospirota bacterium]
MNMGTQGTLLIDTIRQQIEASIAVKQSILNDGSILEQLERSAQACLKTLRSGGKIIFCGNGGSFADAQHLSAEFTSRFMFDRDPLPSLALGTNNSAISAIGNDYGYEKVFARELRSIARPGDVFIPITTSGNSPNILAAVEIAREMGITTVGWTGRSGGRLRDLCECICIPSAETARIQESHIMLGHILCGLVEAEYFRKAV